MAKMEAKWQCSNCSTENFIEYDPLDLKNRVFGCCHCGKVHGSYKVSSKKKSWLECLPFKGIGDKLPAGVNKDSATGQMFFADPDGSGNKLRADYAKKYGWDPLVMYCNAHKDKPICKDFENRCKGKGVIDLGYLKDLLHSQGPQVVIK